jgi:hypothetical protein
MKPSHCTYCKRYWDCPIAGREAARLCNFFVMDKEIKSAVLYIRRAEITTTKEEHHGN